MQIQRLQSELEQTKEQLVEDAKRLGLSEQDQQALFEDKRLANLPDLSRQAISQLAGPARDVRVFQTRLKQAKEQGLADKKEADRLAAELDGFLAIRGHGDLQTAHRSSNEMLATLRKVQMLMSESKSFVGIAKRLKSKRSRWKQTKCFRWTIGGDCCFRMRQDFCLPFSG